MLAGYIIAFLMDVDTDLNDVGFNAVFGLLHIKACVSLIPENAFKTAMTVLPLGVFLLVIFWLYIKTKMLSCAMRLFNSVLAAH